jgi:hypothetical protein
VSINLSLALDEVHSDTEADTNAPALSSITSNYTPDHNDFVFDTGASHSSVCNKYHLRNTKRIRPIRITGVTGQPFMVDQAGTVLLHPKCEINNVLLMNRGHTNLISASRVLAAGCRIDMRPTSITVYHNINKSEKLLTFELKGGIFVYTIHPDSDSDDEAKPDIAQPVYKPSHSRIPKKTSSNSSVSGAARKALDQARATRNTTSTTSTSSNSTSSSTASSRTATSAANLATETKDGEDGRILHALGTQDITNALASYPDMYLHTKFGHQSLHPYPNCTTCLKAKAKRAAIGSKRNPDTLAKRPLDRLHADIVGKVTSKDADGNSVPIPTMGGNIYALIITDEFSRYSWVILLKNKSDAANEIMKLMQLLRNKYGRTVGAFHSDYGGEFTSNVLKDYFTKHGIEATFTTAHTPEHNGLAENTNGVIFNITRADLIHASAPNSLWGEAIHHAIYIRNRTPRKVLNGKTPFEVLEGYAPTANKLHTFGCDAYVTLHRSDRGKLDPKAELGIYLGISETRNCYRIGNPITHAITFTRNASFIEDSFIGMRKLVSAISHDDTDTSANTAATGATIGVPIEFELLPFSVVSAQHDSPVRVKSGTPDFPNTDNTTTTFDDDAINHDTTARQSLSPAHTELDVEQKYSPESPTQTPPDSPHIEPISPISPTVPAPVIEATVTVSDLNATLPITRRSQRNVRPVSRYGMLDPRDFVHEDQITASTITGAALMSIVDDLTMLTYQQAMSRPDRKEWEAAIVKELDSLKLQNVYETVKCPAGIKPIHSRWLFKIKFDSENKPVTYKARVVAKGYLQQAGVDYDETYAPVARMKSIRILLSIAAKRKMKLKQLDYQTAFLNAELDKPVFMTIPQGIPHQTGEVWKLNRALYGLKQSPNCWNGEIDSYLQSIGYKPTKTDVCMYIKPTTTGRIILCLYVDDTVVAYHPDDESTWLADKAAISSKYPITDLGDLKWLLNMEVIRDPVTCDITLNQSAFIEKVLATFQMDAVRTQSLPYVAKHIEEFTRTPTSVDTSVDDNPTDGDELPPLAEGVHYLSDDEHKTYRKMVGALLYAAGQTRIDIAYTVNILCRYVAAPTNQHLSAAKHLLRYLAGTKRVGLSFKSDTTIELSKTNHSSTISTIASITTPLNPHSNDIIAFADAAWANDYSDRKSTSGVIVALYNNVISWITRKQCTVATSTAESEYMSMVEAVKELLWCRSLINEIFDTNHQTLLLNDNQAALAMITSPSINHNRSKHIDVRHHFIKDYVQKKIIHTNWVPTNLQLADLLTKCVSKSTFNFFSGILLTQC